MSDIDISSCLDIPGWMDECELKWLAESAQKCQWIIEVGSWCGRSTRALALHTPGKVYAVDLWAGLNGATAQDTYDEQAASEAYQRFQDNCGEFFAPNKIQFFRKDSLEAAAYMASIRGFEWCDMIFLDGAHDYKQVYMEIVAYRQLLKPGGIFCGHDIGFPGVNRAVTELVKNYTCPAGQIWVAK